MTDLKTISVSLDASALDAMRAIQYGSEKIALVVSADNTLLGLVTDGDIRRGLLKGKDLNSSVEAFMNKSFSYLKENSSFAEAQKLMKSMGIQHLPIISETGKILKLQVSEHYVTDQNYSLNSVVIMAGGRGTRLLPYTKECPKPMLHVGGKPMLHILLEQCIESGFKKFYISVNYLKEQIIDYFGDGSKFGIQISYLIEDEPLGTAGSLKLLPSGLTNPFVLMNADVLTHLNLSDLITYHHQHKADITVCAHPHKTKIPFGVIEYEGPKFIAINEKPTFSSLVNAGIYVLNPHVISMIPDQKIFDMPDLLQVARSQELNVIVCPIHEYWLDIGRPETLNEAHQKWEI